MTLFYMFFVWNTLSEPCAETRRRSAFLNTAWANWTERQRQYVARLIVDTMCD